MATSSCSPRHFVLMGLCILSARPGLAADDRTVVDCGNTQAALSYWRPIRAQVAEQELPADSLALQLLPCLGSSNSELRDRIGYEFFTYWLRNDKLADETRKTLLRDLSERIASLPADEPTDAVFSRSFSALILAEIMRSDAARPFMSAGDRESLLSLALRALANENDYRGLEPDLGWVHPVAHQSDLLWRFALHPMTSATQARAILAGVRRKVAITEASYHFNEGDRMARIVSTIAGKQLVDSESMIRWLASFGTPQSMPDWDDAYKSQRGMAELHNSKQFLRALSDQLHDMGVEPAIQDALSDVLRRFNQLV